MFANLFVSKPPLDEESVEWIFEVYAWALRNLGTEHFRDRAILVNPTNEHFPGRAQSLHGMAGLIFRSTVRYAGMAHWPVRLLEPGAPLPDSSPTVRLRGPLQLAEGEAPHPLSSHTESIPIAYDPALVGNPEALIAGFAQNLAHYLGAVISEPAPGGVQSWPQATEVLAVFMGFGLMFANTALTFQARSCGSCGGASAQRRAFLSQYDITYALALFCALKGIPERQALRHLKKSLRSYFKRCVRDLSARQAALPALLPGT
jgi:hypothetical protein